MEGRFRALTLKCACVFGIAVLLVAPHDVSHAEIPVQ